MADITLINTRAASVKEILFIGVGKGLINAPTAIYM